MTIRRLLTCAALGAVVSVVVIMPAGAAEPVYPPEVATLTVSASAVATGGAVTVSGSGFEPASTVQVTVENDGEIVQSFSTTADSTGAVTKAITLSNVGTNTITVTGVDPDGAARVLVSTVTVSSSGSSSSGGLPNTGANTVPPLVLGTVLVLAGAVAVLAARRRRGRAPAE